jgi:hypothetical protein
MRNLKNEQEKQEELMVQHTRIASFKSRRHISHIDFASPQIELTAGKNLKDLSAVIFLALLSYAQQIATPT